MTEAEIMEQINSKKALLENYHDGKLEGNATTVKTLEDEIKQLESSLASVSATPKRRRSAFLDECAG
jgi:hypothetical protein